MDNNSSDEIPLCSETYSGRACGLPTTHTEPHRFFRDMRTPVVEAQPSSDVATEKLAAATDGPAGQSPSGKAWAEWFDRLGAIATVDVVNATANLVIAEREIHANSHEAAITVAQVIADRDALVKRNRELEAEIYRLNQERMAIDKWQLGLE